ncbi:MAG: TetR/AcrR family transcriptional regulator [Acidimicrobiales bacterium]
MPAKVDLGAVVDSNGAARSPSLDRVLDAAYRCFLAHGVRGTTMADVADEAGVSRVWVHRLAGSRDDLIAAVVGREVERLLVALVSIGPAGRTATAALGDAFGAVVSHLAHEPLIRRLVDHESDVILPALTTDDRLVTALTDAVAGALALDTGRDPASLRSLGEAIVRLAVSLVVLPRAEGGDTPAALSAFARTVFGPALDAAAVNQ